MPFNGVLVAMSDSIGNTLSTALPIIIGTTTKRFSDSVEFGDQDYFRFNLSSTSSLNLTLAGLSANADVELLNSAGSVVQAAGVPLRSTNEGTLAESINAILPAGTYFIRVIPGPPADPSNAIGTTPSTNYSLDVQATNGISNDIVWRYYGPGGVNGIWRMDGTTLVSADGLLPMQDPNWQIVGATDFNGDGTTDLLWRYQVGGVGANGMWLMSDVVNPDTGYLNINGFINFNPDPDAAWYIKGFGNFDGGVGQPDILWQNPFTGELRVWFVDATGQTTAVAGLTNAATGGPATLGFGIPVQALGDFNGDGQTDIVSRDGGTNTVWLMNGTTVASIVNLTIETDLNKFMQGAGDFNGDGSSDLLWRNYATGENEIWLMEGTSRSAIVPLPTVSDTTWNAFTPYTRSQPLVLSDVGGPTLASAFEIGVLNGNGVYRDEVGRGADTNDYYRFSLGSPTQLNLVLDGLGPAALSGNLDVQILSQAGAVISTASSPGTAPESIANLSLAAGTYFIRVFPGVAGEISSYDLNLSVNNLPVLASSGPLTLSEGGAQTLSNNLLLVTDENDPPLRLVYTLVTPPSLATGSLLSNGQALIANSTFTQADINAGRIAYQHNGSETTQDAFVFGVSDGRGGTIPNTTFAINVTPVNDPPVLRSLNPITVSEDNLITLSNTALLVTDVEQGPGQIAYTITSLPTAGNLSLLSGALVGPLTLGTSFTQADINSGRIGYRQNGSENTSDSFTFVASDGAGGFLNPQTQTLGINITPVNDPPVLVTNVPMTVSQGQSQQISTTLLNATDAELLTPALRDRITYQLTSSPTSGTLFRAGTPNTPILSFTQADLDNGRIFYVQNGSAQNSDRFTFTLSDGLATVPATGDFAFEIFVPIVAGPPVLATLNPRTTLSEGTSAVIDTSLLQVTDPDSSSFQITYTVGATPTSGSLLRLGTELTTGQTFTQFDIDNNRITYLHNGNEQPPTDAFTFTFKDQTGAGPTGTQTFSLFVSPVNDAPVLVTPQPLFTVTEGNTVILSQTLLNATDPDNLPQEIFYTIGNAPTNGTLFRSGTQVDSFTQADINGGQITYVQNGAESTSDSFSFSVVDLPGASGGSGTVNINVIPFNDAPGISINSSLTLNEGGEAAIDSTFLLVTDNDGPGPITYTVGALPVNGALRVGNLTLSTGGTFTQANVTNGQLFYVSNGNDVLSDRFTFTASDGATTGLGAPGQIGLTTFSISVLPVNDAPLISAPISVTATEDVTFTFSGASALNVVDGDGGPNYTVQVSALSGGTINLGSTNSLTNLSGNNSSAVTFESTLGNLNAALRNLRYRGLQDFNGTELLVISVNDGNTLGITDRTVTLNVAPVNDGPTLTASTAALNILEDQTPSPTFSFNVTDVDSGASPLSVVLRATNGGITITDPGTLSFDPSGANGGSVVIFTGLLGDIQTALSSVSYQSNPNYFGTDRILVSVNDQGANGAPGPTPSTVFSTINVNVTAVNDAPTFTVTGNSVINVNEDAPQQVVSFASNIFTGAANEVQNLSFSIAPSSPTDASLLPTLFTATPTINPTSGNLTFTPRANANGTVTLSAFLVDNGGTANGGQNTSTPFQFVIEVNQVNDAPSFNRGTVPTVTEDSGPITINNWATNISVGPTTAAANESGQTPTFIFDTNNPSLFASGPQVVNLSGNTGALTFTPAPDANGIATVTVRLRDDGGTANGGVDTSTPQTFTINVLSRNDAPTFNPLLSDVVVLEDDPQQSVQIADTIVVGPFNELTQTATFSISSNSNPNLFLAAGGGLAPQINPQGFLTFKTAANAFGSAVLVARLVDNGGTANGGSNQSTPFTFTVSATAVNDAPAFTLGRTTVSVNEDAIAQTITNFATNISPGPGETGQVVTFVLDNNNPTLFSAGPAIDSTGRLTYTPAANAFGTAIVTASLVDNGGVANGGVDTSTPRLFTITVNPVNDAPTFLNVPGAQAIQEDQVITFSGSSAIQFTDIDSGTNPIQVQVSVRNGTVLLPSTTGLTVTSGANGGRTVTFTGTVDDFTSAFGSLVYTPNPFFNGTDGVTVTVNDRGFFGSGGQQSIQTIIPITISAVNNAPELLTLGQLVVAEGGTGVISNTLLRTTDVDNTPAQLVYTLLDAPDSGSLRISTGGGFTTIALNGTFTQADINANRVSYIQNGSESTTDNFVFGVSDGAIALPDSTFNINIIPVNDPPGQSLNLGVSVNEGEVVGIDGGLLQFTDNDNLPTEVVYTLTSSPTTGTLRLGGSDLTAGSTFTQDDLNIGLLSYEQNGAESTNDSFNFRVSDGTSTIQSSFNITVVPVNDPPRFISQGVLTLNEGASSPLTNVLVTTDPDTPTNQLIYTLTGGPGFGTVLRNNSTTITAGQTFTQAEVNSGAISYRNNGSEVSTDAFFFTVSDGNGSDSSILNINVNPVNDPPVLVRSLGLTLSAASPTTRVISNSQLFATDVDNTDPKQILYRVTALPNASIGSLRLNGTALTLNSTFTQDDINFRRVSYQYLGGGTSDGFQFTLLDVGGATGGSRFFPISFTA
jgi:hypothetical protein